MEKLLQDLRYATRTLLRSPGFTAVAVLTLALGIGANTAIFSVVNSVLLRPLPYEEPDRLVSIWPEGSFAPGGLLAFQDQTESFDRVAGYTGGIEVTLTDGAEPVRLESASVTAGFFDLLGVEAALGRTFLESEHLVGEDAVVVLSHGFWRERFGSDPGVIGREIQLDGVARTVIGVLPRRFRFPTRSTRLWVPAVIDPTDRVALWASVWLNPVARLEPAATVEQAQAELDTFMPRLRELFPWYMPEEWGRGAAVVPLKEEAVGAVRPTLLVLLGATGFVLLIACANVANLLLARATGRQHEVAVRSALGAGRRRLLRQHLTEAGLIGLLGGVAGLLLAYWGVETLVSRLPAGTPRLEEIAIDGRALAFTAGLALLTAGLFGLLPALRASQLGGAHSALVEGGRSGAAGTRQRRVSAALVISEVALAVVLVIGAGLLIKSFWRMLQVDPGFRTEHLITAVVAPPAFRYQDDVARRTFYQELLRRLETLPGVQSAAVATGLPFGGGAPVSVFTIEGRPDPATQSGDWPWADARVVISDGYLRTLGVALLRGRTFTAADRADAPGVAIINRSMARRYWPDDDPIGERIQFPGQEEWETMTIVGIVEDVKRNRLTAGDAAALYLPMLQAWTGPMRVAVRTAGDPATVAGSLRSVVASLDRDTPVSEMRTMEQLVSASVAEPRFTMLLLAAFAGIALLLGAVGIYGVIAYAVGRRTNEVGIRMALGARRGDVLRLVVGEGAGMALVGVGVGLVAALGLTRFLSGMLYGVGTIDPFVFAAVAVLLAGVALLASYLPARRAARVDPMVALRHE